MGRRKGIPRLGSAHYLDEHQLEGRRARQLQQQSTTLSGLVCPWSAQAPMTAQGSPPSAHHAELGALGERVRHRQLHLVVLCARSMGGWGSRESSMSPQQAHVWHQNRLWPPQPVTPFSPPPLLAPAHLCEPFMQRHGVVLHVRLLCGREIVLVLIRLYLRGRTRWRKQGGTGSMWSVEAVRRSDECSSNATNVDEAAAQPCSAPALE